MVTVEEVNATNSYSEAPYTPFVERRASPRFPYHRVQRYASIFAGRLPSLDDFRPMRCNDLSLGGISFFLPTAPDCDRLVVELTPDSGLTYMEARVVTYGAVNPDGVSSYIVRCQFLREFGEKYPPQA